MLQVAMGNGRIETTKCQECGGPMTHKAYRTFEIFCESCRKRRCLGCEIVLVNRYECRAPGCHQHHGKESEIPGFCEECIHNPEHGHGIQIPLKLQ